MMSPRSFLPAFAVLICAVCFSIAADPPPKKPQPRSDDLGSRDEPNEKRFHKKLLELAKDYRKFKPADGDYRWSPFDCRVPAGKPARLRFSESSDNDTHGRKLYMLFAKHRDAYRLIEKQKQPADQAVVKESWHVPKGLKPAKKGAEKTVPHNVNVTKQADLFIMFHTDAKTPGTDEGWVYGTVTSDGKRVTSAGMVQSCMRCHKAAPHGRLFGLPKPSKEKKDKS